MSRMCFFFFKQKTAYEVRISAGVHTCALPILAWRSSVATIGTSGPTFARSAASSSPSASSVVSVTMAPCSASTIPSNGPSVSIASSSAPLRVCQVSAVHARRDDEAVQTPLHGGRQRRDGMGKRDRQQERRLPDQPRTERTADRDELRGPPGTGKAPPRTTE